ncbi:hypothetical protein [Sorangium cellulosum]|uniref:hypothetical protein n=1 Tax=Sorangium cellulosum TaxID=56 RepID=UPI001F5E295C|nr:hypothetical protein [Sorangium cellulosum]
MILLCGAETHAAPEPPRAGMRLEVVRGPGAEGCPDEMSLRTEVARGLGADPFQDDAPRALTVRIAREGPEHTASMALRDAQGETHWAEGFSTRSGCEELLSGVALAVVAQLLSAPEQASAPPERSPPPVPSPPSEPPSPPLRPPSSQARRATPEPARRATPEPARRAMPEPARRAMPEPARRAERPPASAPPETAPAPPKPLRLQAGLGATLGLGITPGTAAGVTLAVGVRRSDWSIAVEGRGLVSLAQEVKDMALSARAFTAAGVGCLHGRHLFGCGVATGGFVRFVPRHPWHMTERDDALFSIGARLGSAWALSDRWSAHGYAEASAIVADAVLRRQGKRRETAGAFTWSSPPVGAALGLGITATY